VSRFLYLTKHNVMGIRGLHICIKKTIPDVVTPVRWQNWSGCRIGIDIQCFLYRAISRGQQPLEAIASQLVYFKSKNINVIYIFDGKPPSEKDATNDKRGLERRTAVHKCSILRLALKEENDISKRLLLEKEIRDLEMKYPVLTHEIKDEVKRFLYATGTLFICASCESDTLLAYWYRRGVIDAVASHDYDFIARGCRLLAPKQGFCSEDQFEQWEDYQPNKIWKGLGLTESKFVDLCVLLGSDYSPGLPIVPWKSALHALQHNETLDMIWARHTFSNWRQIDMKQKLASEITILRRARRILCGEDDLPDTMMDSIQTDKWSLGQQNVELAALHEFRKVYSNWCAEWWSTLLPVTASS
jgi:flap endonuclease-1